MSDDRFKAAEEHLAKVLKAKEEIRRKSIQMSFEEKISRIIEMQKIERELKKDKGKKVYVWSLE